MVTPYVVASEMKIVSTYNIATFAINGTTAAVGDTVKAGDWITASPLLDGRASVVTAELAGAAECLPPEIMDKLDAIPGPTGITHKHPCPTCGQAVYSESVDRLFAATEKCIDAGDTDAARANLDTLRAQLGDDDLKVIGLEVMIRFTEDPSGDF